MAAFLYVMLLAAYMVTHHFPGHRVLLIYIAEMEKFPYSLEVMPGTHTLTCIPLVMLIP